MWHFFQDKIIFSSKVQHFPKPIVIHSPIIYNNLILTSQAYPLKEKESEQSMPAASGILEGCFEGRSESQKVIYEQYYKKMYAICLRYTGNGDEAKDLLQDGFIKLFDKLKARPEIQNFDPWIRRLFINHCLDYVRSAYKKYIVYQGEQDLEDSPDPNTEQENAEYLVKYSTDQIIAAFGKLRHDYRVVLNLFAIENYSHQEIAEMLGIRDTTSRSKLMRARNQLKKILEGIKK